MTIQQLTKTTKFSFIVAAVLLLYGYICRLLPLYFFWESKFIGWIILIIALVGLLLYRIRSGKNLGRKRIIEKIGVGILIFILIVQTVFFVAVLNSDAYQVAKTIIENDQLLRKEVGEIRNISIVPIGEIASSSSNNEESGKAEIHVIVKGSKKFLDAAIFLVKEKGEEWKVERSY